MINICLISNYNYSNFIGECIKSVLNQTIAFDQILIVDDGSTDNSLQIIDKYKQKNKCIDVLVKNNGGQLSTFNYAHKHIPDSSFVYLLDADDLYPRDYLELCIKQRSLFNSEFYYCNPKLFKKLGDITSNSSSTGETYTIKYLKSSALARSRKCWIGNPTSCISLSGKLFNKIFPYPHENDFITRADDVIIFASSIVGSQKVFLKSFQIFYRDHGKNNFHNTVETTASKLKHQMATDKLFDFYCEKFSINRNPTASEYIREYFSLSNEQIRELNLPGIIKSLNRVFRKRLF